MFQSPFVAIFREISFYEGFITKAAMPLYTYNILSFKYVIPLSVKIWNTDKIICAKFTWVGNVEVLCVLHHHTSKVVLLRYWYNTHSVWTLPTRLNVAQIILSVFYILTDIVNLVF